MCDYVNWRWPAANITIQTQVAEGEKSGETQKEERLFKQSKDLLQDYVNCQTTGSPIWYQLITFLWFCLIDWWDLVLKVQWLKKLNMIAQLFPKWQFQLQLPAVIIYPSLWFHGHSAQCSTLFSTRYIFYNVFMCGCTEAYTVDSTTWQIYLQEISNN